MRQYGNCEEIAAGTRSKLRFSAVSRPRIFRSTFLSHERSTFGEIQYQYCRCVCVCTCAVRVFRNCCFLQTMVLMAEIDRMATLELTGAGGKKVLCPIVVAGDFNAQPLCPLYHFVVRGKLIYGDIADKSMDGEYEMDWTSRFRHPLKDFASDRHRYIPSAVGISNRCRFEEYLVQSSHTAMHNLRLVSAYPYDDPREKSDAANNDTFTTRHTRACCTVDYIFFSPDTPSSSWWRTSSHLPFHRTLRLLARRRGVSKRDIAASDVLPNAFHSSDHLPIQAFFQFTAPKYR